MWPVHRSWETYQTLLHHRKTNFIQTPRKQNRTHKTRLDSGQSVPVPVPKTHLKNHMRDTWMGHSCRGYKSTHRNSLYQHIFMMEFCVLEWEKKKNQNKTCCRLSLSPRGLHRAFPPQLCCHIWEKIVLPDPAFTFPHLSLFLYSPLFSCLPYFPSLASRPKAHWISLHLSVSLSTLLAVTSNLLSAE